MPEPLIPYLLTAVGLLAMLALWVVLVEPRRFRVVRRRVVCDNPALREPLTVLHISDFHLRPGERAKARFIRGLADIDVDLVVMTGDMIDENDAIEICWRAVETFHPRLAAFAALGGHDYYRTRLSDLYRQFVLRVFGRHDRVDTARLVEGLEQRGVQVVVNRRVELDHRGMAIDVVGLDDPRHGAPDLEGVFAGCRESALKLVLIHEPSLLGEIVERGPDVVFAGHTHGGQVRIPGYGALATQSDLEPRHASGVFRRGRTVFHLTNGIGTGRFTPIRVCCRPEAVIVEIVPRGADPQGGED